MKISEIMRRDIPTLKKDDLIGKAISIMSSEGLWILPVVSGEGKLIGVLSYKELLERRVGPKARVSSIMYPPYSVYVDDDVGEAIGKIYMLRVRGVPVVDRGGYLAGLVMREDIIKYMMSYNQLPGGKVQSIMSSPVITVDSNESVARARIIMLKNGVTKLPVVDGGKLYGIISMRDLAEKIYYVHFQIGPRRVGYYKTEEEILAAPVRDIASTPVITVDREDPIRKVAELIIKKRYSGFPVMDGENLVGIVTSFDIIKSVVRVREAIPIEARISDLEDERYRESLNRLISSYTAKISRLTKILDMKVVVKRLSKAGEGGAYIVNVYIKTNDDQYSVEEIDKDPLIAARRAFEIISKKIYKYYDRLRTLKRKRSQQEYPVV
ncbi:MAG: CBS domain-containing protein [Sulfolobales archaeon]